MIRSTSFVDLVPGASPGDVDRLVDAVRESATRTPALVADAGRTAPAVRRGADLVILAAFEDEGGLRAAHDHPYVASTLRPLLDRVAARVETVRYPQGPARRRDPGLAGGIQRTLALRVDPRTAPATLAAFERDLADMHEYIGAIANSSLSRVSEVLRARGPVWTHVWEQEYEVIEGLTVDYMQHAYHWSYVDTWFDPQAPNHIVERTLVHVACDLRRSILALAPGPGPA